VSGLLGIHPRIKANKLAGISIQTSAVGVVIPIVYGQARVTGNLLYYTDFDAIAHTSQQNVGGKGGAGKIANTTYSYFASIIVGIAEGPIVGIVSGWEGSKKYTWADFTRLGYSLLTGTPGQAPWSYLTSKHPSDAIGYDSTACVVHSRWPLSDSATLNNNAWEVNGLYQIGGGILDANPADIIPDVLTNAARGVGFALSSLDDLSLYRQYCTAAGLFLSPVVNQQQPISSYLTEWAAATNSAVVWSGGLLKIIPYGDTPITGNGVTYTPNTTPIYDLTDDDFLAVSGQNPVQVTRKAVSDCYNWVQVQFDNRAKDYNSDIAEAKDQASIEATGLRQLPVVQLSSIKDPQIARTAAQLILQRQLYVRNTYTFKLGWRYILLEPMDLATLTDAGLGMNKTPVRITEISESAQGDLDVTAEDWPFGTAHATLYPQQVSAGFIPNANIAPGSVAAPVIFEAPPALSDARGPEIWIGVTGEGADWGGCDVWMATDGVTYKRVATLNGGSIYGALLSALPAYAGAPVLDTTDVLSVELFGENSQLASGTLSDVQNGVTLAYVDGEFLAYETATLTGAAEYSLATLNRGLYNSPAGVHGSSAAFVRCDQAIARVPFPMGARGQTLSFKFTSFNKYGGGEEGLADVSAYTHTFIGNTDAPLSPALSDRINPATGVVDVLFDGAEFANETRCAIRTDRAPTLTEILAGVSGGVGVQSGACLSVATVQPHTKFWIGGVSLNAQGVVGDPQIITSEWLGIGTTPQATVSFGAKSVSAAQITWPVTFGPATQRVYFFVSYTDADPNSGTTAGADVESLVGEVFTYYDRGEPGVVNGVVTLKVPIYLGTHWVTVTAVPIDALNQRGVKASVKSQGPGASPPSAPGAPTLTAGTATDNSDPTTVTFPSSGTAAAKIRPYLDGEPQADVAIGAWAYSGTQGYTFSGATVAPGTTHSLQASLVTSGGVEGPLSSAISMTCTGTSSGGAPGGGSALPTPSLTGYSYDVTGQQVLTGFAFGSGTPSGMVIKISRSITSGGTYVDQGIAASASPAAVSEGQLSTAHTIYYKATAHDPTGAYSDSSPSAFMSVTVPAGKS